MAIERVSRSNPSLGKPKEAMHEMIAKRAFEICQKRGCRPGNEWSDWFDAEKEIRAELQADISGKK